MASLWLLPYTVSYIFCDICRITISQGKMLAQIAEKVI